MQLIAHITSHELAPFIGTFLIGVLTGLGLAMAMARGWSRRR